MACAHCDTDMAKELPCQHVKTYKNKKQLDKNKISD